MSVLLMAVTSTLLELAIAVSSKEVFEAQTYSNFFRFPMLFLSGVFLPIDKLPIYLQPISYCLPLTYGADMLNGAIMHAGFMNVYKWIPLENQYFKELKIQERSDLIFRR